GTAAGIAAAAPGPVATVTPAPAARTADDDEEIRIDRDQSGQFHLDIAVNGASSRFLIDTGADVVALTEDDARRAGIAVSGADYQPILQTASGQGYGARVKLDRVQIGRAELRDVDAVVVRELAVSLLGQSVLRRVGRVELRGDQIVLEPNT
ncbi:MAG TPA: TIGR02281 family clan AA aspartic protease, partial [Novosphingobium sp.]